MPPDHCSAGKEARYQRVGLAPGVRRGVRRRGCGGVLAAGAFGEIGPPSRRCFDERRRRAQCSGRGLRRHVGGPHNGFDVAGEPGAENDYLARGASVLPGPVVGKPSRLAVADDRGAAELDPRLSGDAKERILRRDGFVFEVRLLGRAAVRRLFLPGRFRSGRRVLAARDFGGSRLVLGVVAGRGQRRTWRVGR